MSVTKKPDLKLGYAEYVLYPNDGMRHEIIDGDHYMNPAPSTYHQTISKRLQYHLYAKIELAGLGLVFNAPVDVQLSNHDIVQPDLVVLLTGTRARVTPAKIAGAPDLLVEILSPSTAENDQHLKRRVYERAGVTEYWIVDPEEPSLTQLVLRDGAYTRVEHGSDLTLAILPDVAIPLSEIW
ncbi:MAG: Uma2 family endonuclease [Pirellulaceae bacterium]|nr:Uma2 family endonuclease [Pirellulaceae bacterium]